jgi:hypothetical protein
VYVSKPKCVPRQLGRRELTVGAVKVCNTEDVGSAALRSAVESRAWSIGDLAVLNLNWGGEGNAGEDGSEGKSELHGDCVKCFCGCWWLGQGLILNCLKKCLSIVQWLMAR